MELEPGLAIFARAQSKTGLSYDAKVDMLVKNVVLFFAISRQTELPNLGWHHTSSMATCYVCYPSWTCGYMATIGFHYTWH